MRVQQFHIPTDNKRTSVFTGAPSIAMMGDVRHFVAETLLENAVDDRTIDKALLAVSEITANLIHHPTPRPHAVRVSLVPHSDGLALEVADDGPAFADFNAKCETSLQNAMNFSWEESGRGLGLVIQSFPSVTYHCKNTVDSKWNRVLLPLSISKTQIDKSSPAEPNRKPHVFVIDDDEICRILTHQALSRQYNVTCFDNGSDAVAAFAENTPDAVICDILMPEMNGVDLRRKLSALPKGDLVPFIFLSASSEHERLHSDAYINKLGIDGILQKPLKPAELSGIVDRLMARSLQLKQKTETQMGDAVTRILRPSLPQHMNGGWRAEVYNTAADAGGGDLLVHTEDADGTTIIMADVMGSGIAAKFFAYAYAGYLRSFFMMQKNNHDPAAILSSFSHAVRSDSFLDPCIITCLCLRLHRDGRIAIANAGHPPPYLARNTGKGNVIDVTGPIAGLVDNHAYTTRTLTLTADEMLLLYTDGFIDIMQDDSAFLSGKASADLIWQRFMSRAAHEKPDDATFVSLTKDGL